MLRLIFQYYLFLKIGRLFVMSKVPDFTNEYIGFKFKRNRERVRLSIAMLSTITDTPANRISDFENGVGELTISELHIISSHLVSKTTAEITKPKHVTNKFANSYAEVGEGLELCRAFIEIEDVGFRLSIIELLQSYSSLNANNSEKEYIKVELLDMCKRLSK